MRVLYRRIFGFDRPRFRPRDDPSHGRATATRLRNGPLAQIAANKAPTKAHQWVGHDQPKANHQKSAAMANTGSRSVRNRMQVGGFEVGLGGDRCGCAPVREHGDHVRGCVRDEVTMP